MNQNVCARMFFNRESEYGMGGFFAPILSMSTVVSANQPLLHFARMLDLGRLSFACGGEELVEVELVELSGGRDLADLIGHLIGHQHHTRQRLVRVLSVCRLPLLLGALFVGVCPVEDLLLDELAVGDRAERCARQEQVRARGDGQEIRVALFEALVDQLGDRVHVVVLLALVLLLEQFAGAVSPSTEVVFVEDDQIPVDRMNPLVTGFDAAGLVTAEEILERAEAHDRTGLVRVLVVELGLTGDELPALKILV